MNLRSVSSKIRNMLFPSAGMGAFGSWDGWMWTGGHVPGSQRNFAAEVGEQWKNSVVAACLNWKTSVFPEAPLMVYRKEQLHRMNRRGLMPTAENLVRKDAHFDRESLVGTKYIADMYGDPDHKLVKLLKRPNPHYSGALLWMATIQALDLDGNSYWIKVRNVLDQVVELWWVPWWLIEPKWKTDGSEFVSAYEYKVNGKKLLFAPEDIVHIRQGFDPENIRKGQSRTKAVLRQIFTDNEGAAYEAALMSNLGMLGLVIVPKFPELRISDAQQKKLKELIKQEFSGDNRFGVFGSTLPVEVTTAGYSPEQMALDKLRRIPIDYICANLGVDPMIVGLPSDSKTYGNYEEAKRAAYESTIIPLKEIIASELEMQLLPDLTKSKTDVVGWDYTGVRCLQEDINKLYRRLIEAARFGVLTPNEARRALGYPDHKDGDILAPPATLREPYTEDGQSENENLPDKPDQRDDSLEQRGLDFYTFIEQYSTQVKERAALWPSRNGKS